MTQRTHLTPSQESEIVARYQARESANSLAKDHGCAHNTIVSVLRKHGVYKERRFQGFTPEDRETIFRKYLKGASVNEIARDFSCAHVTIDRMLQRYGVWISPTHLERVGSRYTVEQKREMARQYEAGDSIYKIGHQFEANPQLVWKILKAVGVEFRDNAWKGGRIVTGKRYVAVTADADDPIAMAMATVTGYVLEHRLVMARSIGRPLEPHETVHHINGDKADNRLENLQLRKGKHGTGVVMACLDCGSHNVGAVPLD